MIAHSDWIKLDYIEVFKHHLVIYKRENGLRQIEIRTLDGNMHDIEFPEDVYALMTRDSLNPEYDCSVLRFEYSSLVTPLSTYDYDMNSKTKVLKKREEVKGYNSELYTSKRETAIAPDGTKIPISLVCKKDMEKNGKNSFLLYGYGSYGASIDPGFRSTRISLLDRGMIFAIAHIRGGGEMGRIWYEEGKLFNKKNTFTDFIACAEHVIAENYTSTDKLVIDGRSAGGLLIGAVVNIRPDLFKAAVAGVPFVDVINTMLDPTIPLTTHEYREWGDPENKEYFEYMLSYSPYDNVEEKEYPNMLVTAGLNDPRVHYWEPAKWVARLRATKTDDNILIMKINMGAGHAGASGRYDYLRELAFEYAYILDA
ncbi:MAG: prolyl oligopeptidase family serine peptidase [Candidatus Kariarchaeaceae archaeon]